MRNTQLEIAFSKLLSSKDREGLIQIIEKLTKTKIIIKDNSIFIIW